MSWGVILAERCSKCGQLVQVSDVVCWHCGVTLSEGTTAVSVKEAKPVSAEDDAPAFSARSVLFYATMTAVCLVILVGVSAVFRQHPLFAYDPTIRRPSGWTAVTNAQQQFTLNLPPTWLVIEPEEPGFENNFSSYGRLLPESVMQEMVQATPVNLLAISEANAIVMVIELLPNSQSERQSNILNSPSVQIVQMDKNVLGDEILIFEEVLEADGLPWRCATHLVDFDQNDYAVMSCSQEELFSELRDDFDLILTSFQPLLP